MLYGLRHGHFYQAYTHTEVKCLSPLFNSSNKVKGKILVSLYNLYGSLSISTQNKVGYTVLV